MFVRLLVILVLLPGGLALITIGGGLYALGVSIILTLAALEYARLFQQAGYQPFVPLILGGVLLLGLARSFYSLATLLDLQIMLTLLSTTWHLWQYERGRDQAATDFAITFSGIFYFGLLGGYLIALRVLPTGLWWTLHTLFVIWFADTGAYLIGSRWGRHKLNRRLSPKKSWEGYFGGILFGTISGVALIPLWTWLNGAPLPIQPTHGALLGIALSTLTILGDLGESMVKRQVGAKDSSHLLPGHGGVWDRIDSWLWAAPIAYWLIRLWGA
ncbi:MAG: phosphatidate cytidylyltransferase [Anaerolineales bacterium]